MRSRWIAGALTALMASGAAVAGPAEDAQRGMAFAKQSRAARVYLTPEQAGRICNPYLKQPARLALMCEIRSLETAPAGLPASIRQINAATVRQLWQVVDALDMKALSDAEAKDELFGIRQTSVRALEAETGRLDQMAAMPPVMLYQGETAAAPAPSAPVRTRCDRVPFSVTGTVNCVTE